MLLAGRLWQLGRQFFSYAVKKDSEFKLEVKERADISDSGHVRSFSKESFGPLRRML